MSSRGKRQNDPSVYAVLHRTGRVWRGLVAKNGSGRDSHSPPSILATREFPQSMTGGIDTWLDQYSASEVICVLPASAVICRTCPLPDAPMEQLQSALRLQAEAHLFGIAQSHRLGMAVLEQAPGETARSGIILAWPESANEVELPPTSRPVMYTSDVAALAALVDGHRPTQPLLWLDRSSGSVAVALSHASGVSFRGLREDDEDLESWKASIGRVIAETGLNAGHTAAFIQAVVDSAKQRMSAIAAGESALLIPNEIIERSVERFEGANGEQDWWSSYGIAAGAVLVRTGPLEPLSRLRATAPDHEPSFLRNAAEVMSRPRMAWGLAVACVLVLMFGPLTVNWARLQVLELRHADLNSKMRLVNEVRDSLIVYRELGNNAWPMTKVLSDIACNTPEGVELEFIRINPGGSFTVRGRALPHGDLSATEVVVRMQQNLRQSGIFNEITLNWGDSDAYGNYEFELSARLLHPYRKYEYPEDLDFGRKTLAERLYGPLDQSATGGQLATVDHDDFDDVTGDPQTTRTASTGDRAGQEMRDDPYAELHDMSAGSTRLDRPSPRPSGALGSGATTREQVRGEGGIAPHQDIPEPITQAQVQAMSDAEVRDMLIRVSSARRVARTRNDEELSQRLQREFDWLMARMRGEQ